MFWINNSYQTLIFTSSFQSWLIYNAAPFTFSFDPLVRK